MFLLIFILMLVTQHALGVEVIEGAESVVLPCEAPPGKASSVVWSRYELNPPNVHVRIKTDQLEKDDLTNQNQLFTNRTEVQPDALTTGHVSLTLKHIQLYDRGTYSCTARGGGERLTETQVELQVTSIEEDRARRLRDALITVGIIFLCIVAAVLGWLYRSGYIWQKDKQVEVDSGKESVLLRCRTIRLSNSLPKDVRVQWTVGRTMVHVSLKGSDQPAEQDEDYKGRTEMKMKRSLRILVDLSLTLKRPTDRDSTIYTCTVYSKEGDVLMKREVELEVKVPQVVVDSGEESVLLPCKATVQLPEDVRVQWTDGGRKVHVSLKGSDQPGEQDYLYRGRTEMKRERPGDLSLTLKRPTETDRNLYTCTVYSREGDVLMKRQVKLMVIGPSVQQVPVDSGVESVLLPCETKDQLPEDVRVQWTDGDNLMVHVSLKGSDQPEEQDDLYRGRTEMKRERPGDLSLTLKHPTVRDSKTYTCTVYRGEEDVLMRRQVKLWVKVTQVEVDSGKESVLLPCETTVQLPEDVRVQWTDGDKKKLHVSLKGSDQPKEQDYLYRGRTEMKRERPGDLSLTLKHPTGRDRNLYTCTVYSREGDVLMVRQVRLLVKGPSVQQVPVDSGVESVLLPCETKDQLPEDVRVQWTDGDNLMVHVSLKGSDQPEEQDDLYRGRTEMKRERPGDLSLTLKHPTGRDSKTYTCTVYSREGHVLMVRHVQLWVKEQPVEVKQGAESVLLPFKTTDLPADVRVTWRRLDTMETVHVFQDGSDQQDPSYRGRTEMKRDLRQGDISLILKHPTERDQGRYICRVYSREGDIRRETIVWLYITVQKVEVEQGEESVLLPFKTTDLPEDVRVMWRRLHPMNNVHVFQDSSDKQDQQDPSYRGRTEMKGDLRQGDVSLILKHPTERDGGRYICRVYSRDIRRETTFDLRVTVRPVKKEEKSVLQPEVPELKSTHEGYQLVNMDPPESC